MSEPEPLSGEWPTTSGNEPIADGDGLADQNPANRATYCREHVVATLEAVEEQLDDSDRLYCRSRDLEEAADTDPRTIGGILALVADAPEVVVEEYDIEPLVSVSRWGQQPAGTVWEVSRRD